MMAMSWDFSQQQRSIVSIVRGAAIPVLVLVCLRGHQQPAGQLGGTTSAEWVLSGVKGCKGSCQR